MNTVLWWIIGIIVMLLVAGVLIPEFYKRSARKHEKRLSHRPKRRIRL